MPVYDLSKPADRLALARELRDPQVAAWIVRKHYGDPAVQKMREGWKK